MFSFKGFSTEEELLFVPGVDDFAKLKQKISIVLLL